MIKAFILDDEAKSISNLRSLISAYCHEIEVVGYSQSPIKAFQLIKDSAPDVLFLDIEMPIINGFDFLKLFEDSINFKVVFVTAYNQFAIKAIKVNALDYLLKPISIKELVKTEQKLLKQSHTFNEKSFLTKFLSDVTKDKSPEKLLLPTEDGIIIKPLDDILYFRSENNYTHIHCKDNVVHLISKTLKSFQNLLDSNVFIRIHNSFLVNVVHIEKIVRQDGGYIILKGGEKLLVSRRRMSNLQERVKSTFKTL